MKRLLFALACVGALPLMASAQPVTTVRVTFYRQGATAPATTPIDFPLSSFACNQTVIPPPTGTIDNPTQLVVEDPTNPAADCVLSNISPLLSQIGYDPVNVYVARAIYLNLNGSGPESANSNPFRRPGTTPTAAPARVVLRRGQ